ncbi:hypothetical protein K1719_046899 [Acacia pycnantha]|nr:hypothetical protein K1719_046899 [Acacia pycnantha]
MNIDSTRSPGVTVEKRSAASSNDINQDMAKSETWMSNNDNKQVLTKEKGPQKAEWVQVGSKRKSEGKGRLKGKENKPPGRNRVQRKSSLGQGLEPTQSNSFHALQVMEAQTRDSSVMDISNPTSLPSDISTGYQGKQDMFLPSPLGMKSNAIMGQLEVDGLTLKKDMAHKQNIDETMVTEAKSFPALVRELKGHYKLDFLAIVETRCSKEMSVTGANQLGFPNMEIFDCEGYSGGIWCLWDHNISSIKILERHHQFIHCAVTGARVVLATYRGLC